MTKYFDEGIALFHKEVSTQDDCFEQLSDELGKKNLVTSQFCEKVKEREAIFPTGLAVEGFGIAIPHTDSIYVEKSQIAFMSLTKPVHFHEMGSGEDVQVSLIFMLALKEPHEQLEMLQKLVELFQQPGVLEELSKVTNLQDFQALMLENGLE